MPVRKHSIEVIKTGIPIEEDLDLHEKGWVVQRVGWVLMLAIMLFTGLGLFGEGVLSKRSPEIGTNKITYDRFGRYEKEMEIMVEAKENIKTISLPQDYLKHFHIVRIVPEPVNNQAVGSDVQYNFLGDQNKLISLYIKPEDFGSLSGVFKVNDQAIQLNQFIYP